MSPLLILLALGAEPPQPTVETLNGEVHILKRESELAEAKLAWARARLAKAEGKRDVAAAEGRKVLAYYEAEWKVNKDLAAKGACLSEPAMYELEHSLREVRVWVADVEGNREVLRAELPTYIAFHQKRVRMYKDLQRLKAVPAKAGEDAIAESEASIRRAQERLAELRGDNSEKAGKP